MTTRMATPAWLTVDLVYDHYPAAVEELGWDKFITAQWESLFVGYRSLVGLRSMGRRWSDLFEAGLTCSQDIAERLVNTVIINGPDRQLERESDAETLVSGMINVVADARSGLTGMTELGPDLSAELLDQHARLLSFLRLHALGQDEEEAPTP
jgi:hypothetical protein